MTIEEELMKFIENEIRKPLLKVIQRQAIKIAKLEEEVEDMRFTLGSQYEQLNRRKRLDE